MIRSVIKRLLALIKGGFLHILAGNFLSRAITMISGLVIAGLIDKNEYAYLSYADNLYGYLTLLTGLGLSTALLKHCGVKNDVHHDKAYFDFALRYGTLFEFLASILLCIAVSFINIPYPRARVYMWMLCLIPSLSHIYSVCAIYARTQYENRRYALGGVIQSSAGFVFSVAFLMLCGTIGLVAARYAAVIIALLYVGYYVFRRFRSVVRAKLERVEIKRFMGMGFAMMTASLFSGMMPINEAFLVNNVIRDEITTANFRVAGIFPSMLLLFSGAVTVYFFPIVSQMTDWRKIRKTVLQIGAFTFLFLGLVAAVGAMATPWVIRLIYGTKYVDAIPMTYMLWGMRAMNCCIRIVPMNLLPAIGKTKIVAWTAFLSCIAQVVIDYYMIQTYGILGVAVGAIIVYAISGIVFWIYMLRACGREIRSIG